MPAIKAISGHTGLAAVRRYLERDGRALARDLLHFSRVDEAARQSWRGVDAFDWDVAMDETRRANGNDVPYRGRPARTYKHYVLSPDPRDGITLVDLRGGSPCAGQRRASRTSRWPSSTTTTTRGMSPTHT